MEFSACFLFILGFEDWSCTYGLFYEIEAMGDVFCWFINWPEETSCPSHRFGQNGFLDCQGFEIAHWSVLSGMISSISSLYACFLLFFLINLIKEIANSDSLDSLSCLFKYLYTKLSRLFFVNETERSSMKILLLGRKLDFCFGF